VRARLVALHGGLQRADGVHLRDDGPRARRLHGARAALAHVSVARNERDLPSETLRNQHFEGNCQSSSCAWASYKRP